MVSDDRSDKGPQGTPQGLVPPYDDLRGEPGENTAPAAFDASNAPAPGPPPTVSDEERDGLSATDLDPEPPLGVGRSRGGRAEDQAPDRDDVDTEGASGRPAGKVADDDSAGVGAQGPIDPRSPDLQAGDQGG